MSEEIKEIKVDNEEPAELEEIEDITEPGDVPSPDEKKKDAKGYTYARRRKGAAIYRVFLLTWIAALMIVISVFLGRFYDYLDKYETDYRASRPEVITEDVMVLFRAGDVNGIYDLLSEKPGAGEYESEKEVLDYMSGMLGQGGISFSEDKSVSSEEHPVFDISSGDSVIARAEYQEVPRTSDADIPRWELANLIFPVEPEVSVLIEAPENIDIYINGKILPEAAVTSVEEAPAVQRFFDEFTQIPPMTERVCEGLFFEPVVTARTADGAEVPVVYDEAGGIYRTDYPRDCAGREEMEELASRAVSAYASFVSGDLAESTVRSYFTPDNIFLYYMTHAELRYFTRHLAEEIHSTEVLDFISYSDDAFYCEVMVEQYLTMEWGPREPEILLTDGKFYFVKIDGEWKVAGIEF
ncbi:MAG: hypothetical protein K5871_10830 [Lachnospiraceae bacterium]|nr:hypothetical protein [Lachnospiraceae bacterium]